MSVGGDTLIGLRCHVGFITCVIFQGHKKGVGNGSLVLCITRVSRK